MLTAAPVVNLPPNPGFRDAKWPKVEEAWEYFFPDTKYIEAHRALDDALLLILMLCLFFHLSKLLKLLLRLYQKFVFWVLFFAIRRFLPMF
jgi:hypothetical protein